MDKTEIITMLEWIRDTCYISLDEEPPTWIIPFDKSFKDSDELFEYYVNKIKHKGVLDE